MIEKQICRRCRRVFAVMERSGPGIFGVGDVMRKARESECPHCGGRVQWVQEAAEKQRDEMHRHLKLGCAWGVLALAIGAAILLIQLWVKK